MQRLLTLLLTFALLFPLTANMARAAQPVLQLNVAAGTVSTNGHLSMLRDPTGALSVDAAQAASGWVALPGALSAGYTADTIWLRLQVEVGEQMPQHWTLRFTNALLEDVRLYRPDGASGWTVQTAGANYDRADWPIDARLVVFPLELADHQRHTWLIRLQTQHAMSTELDLWPRAAYENFSRREYLYYGMQFGSYLLLILFHSFFWRMTRESHSGWYLLYVLTNAATELLTVALPQQIFDLPHGLSDRLLGVSMCGSLMVGVKFSVLQLEMAAFWPKLSKCLVVGASSVALVGAALVMSGRFASGVILIQSLALLLIPAFVAMAVWLMLRGHRPARFFLLVFGIFYAGAVVSFLRNLAVVPPNFYTNNASSAGAFIHMLLMSLRMNRRYAALRRARDEAQAETLRVVRALNDQLEMQVERRTSALQQEIGRRELLEQELRQALEAEKHINQEQQDFVAMVSHEFRTPLAIINTSAQQIANNLNAAKEKTLARCRNLCDAARRMAVLMDEYLVADRMETSAAAFKPTLVDPRELIGSVVAEWPPERVSLSMQPLPAQLACDPGLLRVALRNLLSNADRHAPAQQAIEVQIGMQLDDDSQRLHLRIAVSNHGEAILEDEIPRLFQKYFRGRIAQRKPGAGLGLYLVQRIAVFHGGQVRLENHGAHGTIIFALLLPTDISTTPSSMPALQAP